MIAYDTALDLVRALATPLGSESVSIGEARGRVLAKPVRAQLDSPRTDVSAMDGYAVREEDLEQVPAELKVIGQSFAGEAADVAVEPGTCVRIFTGAAVPLGADRVVIQENVRSSGNAAVIGEHPGAARHIRKRGSDFAKGEELLRVGRLLDPRGLVAAAGADLGELEVYHRPRLHILGTGDELAEPGSARESADAIPESVSFGVAALAAQWGAECIGRTRVHDDLGRMQELARGAIDGADLVAVTGGASVGEKDFAKTMFEPLGLELVFSKVSMKPGKPVWLGRVGRKFVLGLPGNPTSALLTARLLLAPLIAGLTGRPVEAALQWRTVPLASPLAECGSRETFHRARWANGAAEILSFQDSSAQKALAAADLLIRQPANGPALEPGAQVEALDF